eukprot:8205278-Alexandrium_andersonii.AAC.1
MSGSQAWGKKNIPKFQREEGAFLKMLTTANTKAVGLTKFTPLWDLNAARTLGSDGNECWVAAVRDPDELIEVDGVTKRLKLLAVADNHDEVAEAMADAWLEWANYGELRHLSRKTTAKQHFVQDHWTYRVIDLDVDLAYSLIDEEDALAKKNEDRWQRQNRLSGGELERSKGVGKGRYERSALNPTWECKTRISQDAAPAEGEDTSS